MTTKALLAKIFGISMFGYLVGIALTLDTKSKKISLKIGLKGELEPLLVTVNRYEKGEA